MTKEYAAVQLLRLGSLTLGDFYQITNWTIDDCKAVLSACIKKNKVKQARQKNRFFYKAL